MATATRKNVPLADELVCRILLFLSPREILRLRPVCSFLVPCRALRILPPQVSKYFDDITRDRQLWVTLYANACLPRPPGPFEWQSTLFLERTLVSSERTSLTWTSPPTLNTVARIQGPRFTPQGSSDMPSWHFVLGRLFIWCEETMIFAQDLDIGTRTLLWKNPTPIQYSSIEALSLNHHDGERIYVAFPDAVENRYARFLMHVHIL